MEEHEVAEYLQLRHLAGKKIDPAGAAVVWHEGQTMDPYDIYTDLSAEAECLGRVYFARSPEGGMLVTVCDVPAGTIRSLWNRLSL